MFTYFNYLNTSSSLVFSISNISTIPFKEKLPPQQQQKNHQIFKPPSSLCKKKKICAGRKEYG
jgi:hypothetical protein